MWKGATRSRCGKPTHGFKGQASAPRLALDDRIRAEHLKHEIRELERAQGEIAVRFAGYARCAVEEQLAMRLAFAENRKRLGRVSQELLRLVCL